MGYKGKGVEEEGVETDVVREEEEEEEEEENKHKRTKRIRIPRFIIFWGDRKKSPGVGGGGSIGHIANGREYCKYHILRQPFPSFPPDSNEGFIRARRERVKVVRLGGTLPTYLEDKGRYAANMIFLKI